MLNITNFSTTIGGIYMSQADFNEYISKIYQNINYMPKLAFYILLGGLALFLIFRILPFFIKGYWGEELELVAGNGLALCVCVSITIIAGYTFGLNNDTYQTIEYVAFAIMLVLGILAGFYLYRRKQKLKAYWNDLKNRGVDIEQEDNK